MTLLQDFLSLLGGCIAIFAVADRPGLMAAIGVGLVLAVLGWVGCSYYSKLWNLRYRVTFTHHILCAFAALLTLAFTLVFASLRYTKEAAYVSVQAWQVQLGVDQIWANATFAEAFVRVKKLGIEDFTGVPLPGFPESHIPTNQNASILTAATTYAQNSTEHFRKNRPFLSMIIQAKTEVPLQLLDSDVKNYFATVGKSYPPLRGILLVAMEIKKNLEEQLPKVVTTYRRICVGLFAFAQLIPFTLVGIAAYKNLKVRT